MLTLSCIVLHEYSIDLFGCSYPIPPGLFDSCPLQSTNVIFCPQVPSAPTSITVLEASYGIVGPSFQFSINATWGWSGDVCPASTSYVLSVSSHHSPILEFTLPPGNFSVVDGMVVPHGLLTAVNVSGTLDLNALFDLTISAVTAAGISPSVSVCVG